MEVVSIERSTYEVIGLPASLVEELLTSFNSFVAQMRAMADRGTDKKLGEWLDNQDVCQMLNISPRTLQTIRNNGTLAYSQINSFFNFGCKTTISFGIHHYAKCSSLRNKKRVENER